MVRAAVPISAFIAGVATALLILYVSLLTAPGVIMADDIVEALTVVASGSLSQFPKGSVIYIKSSVGTTLLEKLQAAHPSLRFRSFSARPSDNGCAGSGNSIPVAPCDRNDFIKLEVLSAPTHGTMLVAVGTAHTFGQVLLLRFLGRWRVLVNRSYLA
jgi:hypothetical protein